MPALSVRRAAVGVAAVAVFVGGQAKADTTTAITESIASSVPYPATTGTHFHSQVGQPVEVGSFSTSEEVRGVAEFDLNGFPAKSPVQLSFTVARIGSSYYGQTGPGNYTINVVTYAGDNAITTADFSAPTTSTVGSFTTTTLIVGQVFTFDVTAGYAAALAGSKSLGIRLQDGSAPGTATANQFSNFTINANAVPEPASIGIAAAAAGLLGRRRRRTV